MQTLTGLYGMNFVLEDGSPNIPELTWKGGYEYFWALSIGCTFLLLCVMHFQFGLRRGGKFNLVGNSPEVSGFLSRWTRTR